MFKKRLIIASYSLIYLGLFSFTYWIMWLQAAQVVITNLSKFMLTLGVLIVFIVMSFMLDNSYFEGLLSSFSQELQSKCKIYFSYLDKVSLVLFVGLGGSLFLGDFVYVLLTKILFYVALGFYLSSSAVILLFLSRK
jgi:hypothetical protein